MPYGVRKEDELIDYDELERLAEEHKPKMIIAGASAYPRIIDFARFREIADSVGAMFLVDMAHISGLVAAASIPIRASTPTSSPSTTHKTLRGPRAGLILARAAVRRGDRQDRVPGHAGRPAGARDGGQGGLLPGSACSRSSSQYQKQRDRQCPGARGRACRPKASASSPAAPTRTWCCVDVFSKGLRGKEAEQALDRAHITVNKNAFRSTPIRR